MSQRPAGSIVAAATLVLCVSIVGGQQPAPITYPADRVPASLVPAVRRALTGFGALQANLWRRLQEATYYGAASAVDVCRIEAGAILERVTREQGIALGRTSHALRNPGNAPPAWAAAMVAAGAGKSWREVETTVFDLGDRVGVLRPISTEILCTNCHGAREAIGADVRDALKKFYPNDQGTGFKPGDLRGWMWAEVSKNEVR